MPAGAQDRPCTQTRTHMPTQNTLTRAQVPGHTPFTQKLKDRFTCALRYMLTCATLISLRTRTCTRMFTPCTQRASIWAETYLDTCDVHVLHMAMGQGRGGGERGHPKQVRCGNHRLLRFSGRGNGGAHPNTPSGPLASEAASRDRTPGPSTRKSPHLQAFREEAFLQQECPPKTPRGESAVASLRVENPKFAPGRGRGRGREAGRAPD